MKRFHLALTVAAFFVGCAPSAPTPNRPSSPHAKDTKDASTYAAIETSHFTILKGSDAIGSEIWNVSQLADGSRTNDFTTTADLGQGKVVVKGTLHLDASSSIHDARIDVQGGDPSSIALASERTDAGTNRLVLTATHPGKPAEVTHDTESSRILLAKPSMSGMFPICRSSFVSQGSSFDVFPGAKVRVLAIRPLDGGGRAIILDLASSLRLEIGCEGERVSVVRVPIHNISYLRDAADATLAAMQSLDERKKPAIPDSLVEEDRTVDVPAKGTDVAATLSCSFVRPKASATAKLPAVVFVTGSGPQDRDEDTVGPGGLKLAIFKTMAIRLADAGVASLRCDDRGTAKSTGTFSAATLETFVRDAHATVDAVRKEKVVDPARVAIVGHSEGGVIGPRVAAQDKSLHSLLLMAAPGESLADIGVKQLQRSLRTAGASADKIAKEVAASTAVIDAIRSGKPLPESLEPGEKAAIEKQRAWLQSELVNDPLRVIAKVKCPVFVAQGAKDEQVPPEDAGALLEALQKAGNKNAKAKTYPELSHLFAPTKTGSMADYSDPDIDMSEEFLGDAVAFLSATLRK